MRNFGGGNAGIARALRESGGQFRPPFSVPAILGASFPTAAVAGRELPDGIEEIVTVTADGPLILYRRGLSTGAQRFAVAHAIAHLVHDMDGVAFVVDAARELRADAFALELLAPDKLLIKKIVFWPCEDELYMDQVDRIAVTFHVPAEQIDRRIRELERLGMSHC